MTNRDEESGLGNDETRFGYRAKVWRDVVLAGVPAAYVLGFLAWSSYSLDHGFGFLELTAARYLLAGTLILAFIGASAAAVSFAERKLRDSVKGAMESKSRSFKEKVHVAGASFLITSAGVGASIFALLFALSLGILQQDVIILYRLVQLGGIIFAAEILLIFTPFFGGRKERQHSRESWRWSIRYVAWPILIFLFFTSAVLPVTHSEFGGAMPRQAILDLETRLVTNSTLEALTDSTNDTADVVRTTALTIVFEKGDSLLVVPSDQTVSSPLYEVRMSAVHAITWLPNE